MSDNPNYNRMLPKSGSGQDPVRPKFGTAVQLSEKNKDGELNTEIGKVNMDKARPDKMHSPSGR